LIPVYSNRGWERLMTVRIAIWVAWETYMTLPGCTANSTYCAIAREFPPPELMRCRQEPNLCLVAKRSRIAGRVGHCSCSLCGKEQCASPVFWYIVHLNCISWLLLRPVGGSSLSPSPAPNSQTCESELGLMTWTASEIVRNTIILL
jgi:hypothetical protein